MDHNAIEVNATKREELKDFLYKYWPDTIEIIHGLKLGEEYNAKIRVITDNCWPDVKTIILIHNEGQITFIFPFGTDISKTVSILKSVVDSQSQIDLQQPLIIGFEEVFHEMKTELGIDYNYSMPLFRYVYTMDTIIKRSALPKEYKIDSIHLSDIDFVVSKWDTAMDSIKMKQLTRHFIINYLNIAIYDSSVEPAQIVSWVVTSGRGVLFHLFTVEEHRGKGLGTVVVQGLTHKILSKGFTPFCYISMDNVKSQKLFKKCGYLEKGLPISYTKLK